MKLTINALDPSQKYILEKLTSGKSDDLSLIYGPPGTGKSYLIMSLIFELALAGKKVLFVSQNREALDVVIRKYKDLDKTMHISDTDLSFLDFCLHLSDRSQRTIKYISSLKSRIWNNLPKRVAQPRDEIDDDIPYTISYRGLDREKNGNITTKEVGIDELLANELLFVKNNKLIKKPLRKLDEIDVRGVFALLREYRDKSESFRFFNNPSDELALLNPISDSAITLNRIYDCVREIEEQFEKIQGASEMSYSGSNDIRAVLRLLACLVNLNSFFDLSAIKKDDVRLAELGKEIKEIESLRARLHNNATKIILKKNVYGHIFDNDYSSFMKECEDMRQFNDYAEIVGDISAVIKKVNNTNVRLIDILASACESAGVDFSAIDSVIDMKKSYPEDIDSFARDVSAWTNRSWGERLVASKPNSIAAFSKTELDQIIGIYPQIIKVRDMLWGTDITYGELERATKGGDRGIKISSSSALKIASSVIKIMHGPLGAWSYKVECSELLERCESIKNDANILRDSMVSNVRYRDMSCVIEAINNKLDDVETESLIKEKAVSIKKYCRMNDAGDYSKHEEILKNNNAALGDRLLEDFTIKGSLDNLDADSIEEFRGVISEVEKSGIFSKQLFLLAKNETFSQWLKRITMLLSFNNRNELGDYITHNDFIHKLKDALGDANISSLEKYLEMDLSFEEFAERVSYDVIRAIFDDIPASKCRTVDTGSYIKNFTDNLNKHRAKYYIDALSEMALRYEDFAKTLSIPMNWKSANSVMEKIRVNMPMITEAYPVIMATPSEVAKYIAPKKELFDYVIFDEASQLLPGQAIPSIYRAKKAVIVGDPHQMPPTSSVMLGSMFGASSDNDEFFDEDLGDSILDRVKAMQIESAYHLKVHYRSKYNILFEPSRKAIYSQDDIRPIFEAKSVRMPLYIRDGLGEDNTIGYDTLIERINSYIERNENAKFCILFTHSGEKGGERGFRQYLETKGEAVEKILKKYSEEELLISTITNCQGISGNHTLLYIPSYPRLKQMWFFKENSGAYKRLNVAVTRQEESLDIIMGDNKEKWITACREMMNSSTTSPSVRISAELMEGLLINAGQQIDERYLERMLGPNADTIDSPLAEELYQKLNDYLLPKYGGDVKIWTEVGYKIRIPDSNALQSNSYNVGYRIDIGIYSVKHNRFVLGIEMDGATYHSGFEKEFSDAQRQAILEDKGWKIYRVWSTNWLNDMEGEFNALIQAIEEELDAEPEIEDESPEYVVKLNDGGQEEGELYEGDEQQTEVFESKVIDRIISYEPSKALIFWSDLRDYLKNCLSLGLPIEIKYVSDTNNKELLDRVLNMPYQKMILKRVEEDYIEARFEDSPSPYKIQIRNIVAFSEKK